MIGLIAFFGTLWGRVAVAGGIFAALVGAWVGFAWHYENKGAAKAVAQIEKKAVSLNEKGLKARASVSNVDDPAGRLLGKYCRDC
jgi:hypothetical protein